MCGLCCVVLFCFEGVDYHDTPHGGSHNPHTYTHTLTTHNDNTPHTTHTTHTTHNRWRDMSGALDGVGGFEITKLELKKRFTFPDAASEVCCVC